ncbi:MAG: hypothetical protein QM731_07565 [Chitinophagaceae bacterium]
MKKALFITGIALVVFTSSTFAQAMGSNYRAAFGFKFYPGALTAKFFIKHNQAIEALGYIWDHGFRGTALYEFHGNIAGAPGLKWYAGPGAHLGVYNEDWRRHHGDHYYYYGDGDVSAGFDGVVGLDYKFKGAPINLSADLQPFVELADHAYMGLWGGVAFRFAF